METQKPPKKVRVTPSTKKATTTESVVQPVAESVLEVQKPIENVRVKPSVRKTENPDATVVLTPEEQEVIRKRKEADFRLARWKSDLETAKSPRQGQPVPFRRGTPQVATKPMIEKAEGIESLPFRVANARFFSDAAITQASGQPPGRILEDIVVPSNAGANKPKGDATSVRDTRLAGMNVLAELGLIKRSAADEYAALDKQIRDNETNLSGKAAEDATAAARWQYVKSNDPRGLQDRLPEFNNVTGKGKRYIRSLEHSNDNLQLSRETRLDNARAFGEFGATEESTIANAKTGVSIPLVSGFKPGRKSSKEVFQDIASHDSQMTEDPWKEAASVEKPLTKKEIRALAKAKPRTESEEFADSWRQDASKIGDTISAHAAALEESKFADERLPEKFGILSEMDATKDSDGVIRMVDEFEAGDSNYQVTDNGTDWESKMEAVAVDDKASKRRAMVSNAAHADAIAEYTAFKAENPSGTKHDFSKHMARRMLEDPAFAGNAENPFAVDVGKSNSGKTAYKIQPDYKSVHLDVMDAIGKEGALGSLASRYASTEIQKYSDVDMLVDQTTKKNADIAANRAKERLLNLPENDPQRSIAETDASEMARYADYQARRFETIKSKEPYLREEFGLQPKDWSETDKKSTYYTTRDIRTKAESLKSEIDKYDDVIKNPSTGYRDRKNAQEARNKAQSAYDTEKWHENVRATSRSANATLQDKERIAARMSDEEYKSKQRQIEADRRFLSEYKIYDPIGVEEEVIPKVDTQQVLDEVLAMADKPVKPAALRTTLRRKPN